LFERKTWSHQKLKQQSLNLALAGLLIGANWFTFIWAVTNGYVIETSVGYFISPILKVFLGNVFYEEKMSKTTKLAVSLAILGVIPSFIMQVDAPWVSVTLASTFGLYGLIKKKIDFKPNSSLLLESGITLVIFVLVNLVVGLIDYNAFSVATNYEKTFLLLSFLPTLLPLYFFAVAATNLTMTSLGFFQYISPIGQFLIGYLVFNQEFTIAHKLCFAFVIPALFIFISGKYIDRRERKKQELL
jgi:chloramphenicol-sensitive protein RarD